MHLVKCNNMHKRTEYQIVKSRLEENGEQLYRVGR